MTQWKLVPIEPTEEMIAANGQSDRPDVKAFLAEDARKTWAAMLTAAPQPDVQPWSESSHGVKATMRVVPAGLAYGVGLEDSDKVFAAFVFRADAETFCKLFNGEVALMAEPAKAECAGFDSPPSSSKMGEPVAWCVFDKRTQKHWYTNESVNTVGYYAKEHSHREADGSPSMLVVPLYTHPLVAPDVQPVGKFAKFTDGIWREVTKGSPGVPLYEHPPAADVQELVEALKWIEKRCNEGLFEDGVLHQEHWKAAHDAGACARAYLKKWEGK